MITLQGKLTHEDYIKAADLYMNSSTWLNYFYLGLALLSFAWVVFVAFFSLTSAFSALAYMLLFGLFMAFLRFGLTPWNVRRVFSQYKALQAEQKIVISSEMIETTSEYITARMPLSDFHKYKVGKDLILLYPCQGLYHVFPRRFFTSEDDFNTFVSYLEANVGSSKR